MSDPFQKQRTERNINEVYNCLESYHLTEFFEEVVDLGFKHVSDFYYLNEIDFRKLRCKTIDKQQFKLMRDQQKNNQNHQHQQNRLRFSLFDFN